MFDEIINEQLIRLIYKLEGWDYEDSDSDSDYEPSDTDDTDDETDDDTVSEDVSFLGCNVGIRARARWKALEPADWMRARARARDEKLHPMQSALFHIH